MGAVTMLVQTAVREAEGAAMETEGGKGSMRADLLCFEPPLGAGLL